MERNNQQIVSGGSALQLRPDQYSVLANSNAISTTHGCFSELTKEIKRALGLTKQKALYCQHSKELKTEIFQKELIKEIIPQWNN